MRLTIILVLSAAIARAATFGDQNAYTSNFTVKDVVACIPASPSESGICDSITAYLKFNLDSCKTRCALYTISGNDTILITNGITQERRFASNASFTWQGFAFADPKPTVTAGTTYFIAVFGDTAGAATGGLARAGVATGGGPLISRSANYESGYPATLNPSSSTISFKMSAYVTYAPAVPIPPRRRHIVARPHSAP